MTFVQYQELRKSNPDLYNHSFTQWRMVNDYKHLGHQKFFRLKGNYYDEEQK